MAELWAHSRNVVGKRHSLEAHLRGTAALAGAFGRVIGAEALCSAAGLLHDGGKCVDPWQRYLLASEAGLKPPRVGHKSAGANLFSALAGEPGRLMIEGHHGGIPNFAEIPPDESIDVTRDHWVEQTVRGLLPEMGGVLDGGSVMPAEWVAWARTDVTAFEMAVRLAHSALVDADFLDTAAHFNDAAVALTPPANFRDLNVRFNEALERELAGRASSPIDGLRNQLRDACLDAVPQPPGIFRLPGPTGSGKTASAAAFALGHAAHHGLRRVVVAVPFLTITEQNAAVYRRLLGTENVVEHHSGLLASSGSSGGRTKYGTENWDAPFVVTTTVQLFESLFSNRPSRTRKLHRLAHAVIILDEVQAIPPRVLPVVLDGLRILTQHFGSTVVLSSATQPTWEVVGPWREAARLDVHNIVPNPQQLYAGLRRSEVEWRTIDSLETVATLMLAEDTCMVIANTTRSARDLARLLAEEAPEGLFHLSTRMYPRHRRVVLAEVKERLAVGLPVRLVTTQLVEAGVDLDFPVVFRAMAPAENLSQARGRCNREGRLSSGRFVVLVGDALGELRDYQVGVAKTRQHFPSGVDLDDPSAMGQYYRDLYATLDVDGQVEARRYQDHRRRLRYRETAGFRMIADEGLAVVVAAAPGAEEVLTSIARQSEDGGAPSPERFRRLQEFSVTVPAAFAPRLADYIREEIPGIPVWRGAYDQLTGITMESSPQDSVW